MQAKRADSLTKINYPSPRAQVPRAHGFHPFNPSPLSEPIIIAGDRTKSASDMLINTKDIVLD